MPNVKSSTYFNLTDVLSIAGGGLFSGSSSVVLNGSFGWEGCGWLLLVGCVFGHPARLTRIKKKITPNRVPWGPPPGRPGRARSADVVPLYLTNSFLFVRYEIRILRSHPGTL